MTDETNRYATGQLNPESPPAPVTAPLQPARRDRTRLLAFLLIGIGIAMLVRNIGGSRWHNEQFNLPLNDAQVVELRIDTGSGNVNVDAGSSSDQLLAGTARHRGELDIDDDGGSEREVLLRTTNGGWNFSGGEAVWELRLNPTPQYTIDIDTGSSQSFLDLSRLRVSELQIDNGTGNQTIVLPRQGALNADIDAGTGNIVLDLPDGRPAQVRIDIGTGNVSADGLSQTDGRDGKDGVYQTADYAAAAENDRIDVELDVGTGNVVLK